MWNAVCLSSGASNATKLNLNVAVQELCVAIKGMGDVNNKKISCSSTKKLIKAQNSLENNKSYEDVVYELIKVNGLSKRAFKRTLKVEGKNNEDSFYVNYKYLDRIIYSLIKYILIVDKNILECLFNFSEKNYPGKDSITYRTIPVRKLLIQNVSSAYINGEKCYLKNKHFQKKVYLLDKRLDEINSEKEGLL